jgi:hypothetical protein
MNIWSIIGDVVAGWCVWSLAHHLGHRWWHAEMRNGKQTFYARGEREHHRVYDQLGGHELEDPSELFISFPFSVVGPVGLVFVAAFGLLTGWNHCIPFFAGFHGSMILDHRLHILFHKREQLPGLLGWFQKMHVIHHSTHNSNFAFVSGLPWDALLGTARRRLEDVSVTAVGVTAVPVDAEKQIDPAGRAESTTFRRDLPSA